MSLESLDALATAALLSCRQAVMASQSASIPGFPFTSVIPLAVTDIGKITILISDIAQHTRNLTMDNRVSILLHDDTASSWQAASRLLVIGHMKPVLDESAFPAFREIFYLQHPELTGFDQELDFHFWQLEPIRFRLVAGFGTIKWIDTIDPHLFSLSPEDMSQIQEILHFQHGYARLMRLSAFGLQIMQQGHIQFLEFEQAVTSPQEALEVIKSGKFRDPLML